MLAPLSSEIKEAALIRKKREDAEKRKERFFNPKLRMFGVDVEAWKQQQLERIKAKEEEELKEKAYHTQKIREDIITLAEDIRVREERKNILQKVSEFRQNYQKFEDRREYDLNDPYYLKKSLPVRLYDDDPRCSVSSAQKFEGEDLQREERLKIQADQTKAWLEQQIEEKRRDDWEKEKADLVFQECLMARDKRAMELSKLEEECVKKLQEATVQYNKSLVEEREAKIRENKTKEEMDKAAEKFNWMSSDMLTENPEVAASNLGPHRVLCHMYKGDPPNKAFETRKVQEQQIEEKKFRQMQEELLEQQWCVLKDKMRKQVYFEDKDIMQKQRELNAQMVEMNKRLAREKKERDDYFNKVANTNVPTEAFYDQFNRSIY